MDEGQVSMSGRSRERGEGRNVCRQGSKHAGTNFLKFVKGCVAKQISGAIEDQAYFFRDPALTSKTDVLAWKLIIGPESDDDIFDDSQPPQFEPLHQSEV
jgi:hypothetical protein